MKKNGNGSGIAVVKERDRFSPLTMMNDGTHLFIPL